MTINEPVTQAPNAVMAKDRSEYALVVQKEARESAEAIRARSMVNSATWASPLVTAPSAVSTMAILLKTSASDVAAGVTVKNRVIINDTGKEIPPEWRQLP